MSEFLGAKISLISKSDIRYVGTLHEINSSDSTVSLENVKSFGTEGRKADPSEEVGASDQTYEYIVFRGSDVKDLRIEEAPAAVKENNPPVPNDPAIVGGRPHPGQVPGGVPPLGPPGAPGFLPNNMYFPPPPQASWGRGGPPPPVPGAFGGMPGYGPPPGWYPPGQGFPPNGPGPWSQYPYPPGPPGPPGPLGPPGPGNRNGLGGPPVHGQEQQKPAPIGPGAERQKASGAPQVAPEPKTAPRTQVQHPGLAAPAPPVASKPSVEEVKATAASLETNGKAPAAQDDAVSTGPKNLSRITPAVPLPPALTSKVAQQSTNAVKAANGSNPAATAAALRDATQAARAAVAVAMANLDAGGSGQVVQQPNGNAMDNLTKKVNEMRVNAARTTTAPNRGRGRGGRPAKVEVPDADFDFASANAKFNKQDVVKEAIAGSPLGEPTPQVPEEVVDPAASSNPQAYNKSRSFFDNISSEAKDRLENGGQKPGGREWRGEEQRRNMETFGQGSVDGGYHRGYRGRGRGRGGFRGRGGQRGGRGNFRGQSNDPVPSQ